MQENGIPFDMVGSQNGLLYIFVIFIIGAAVRHGTDVLRIPIPFTVVIFFVGGVIGYLPMDYAIEIGPHTILYVFLPVLIFEGAFAIDMYVFKTIFIQVLVLAVPSLVVMIALTAGVTMYLFDYSGFNWVHALLLGSILTATDPVAVVAIMKDLGTSKQLSLLIEGEAMLNDGTAMVAVELFMEICESGMPDGSDIIKETLWVSVGGPALGYIIAKMCVFWLSWTFNDSQTEITITFAIAYLSFYIADAFLQVSAVLTVVTFGATLSAHRTSISPEVEVFLHSFWETMGFMANTLIFALCGSIIVKSVLVNADYQDFVYLIILYFALQIIRGLTLLFFSPLLKRLGYGLSWQVGLVTTWSGLRGAVGLALALIVFKSETKDLQGVKDKILFHVALIVVLTLMVNATTVSSLLDFLGMTQVTPTRRRAVKKAIRLLEESRMRVLSVWKIDRSLADANWEAVSKICTIPDPYKASETTEEREKEDKQNAHTVCPSCGLTIEYEYTNTEMRAMIAEAHRKYIKLLKQKVWVQFERGLLTGYSARKLVELCEEATDKDMEMIDVSQIKEMWRLHPNLTIMKAFLVKIMLLHTTEEMRSMKKTVSIEELALYRLSESPWLMLLLFGFDMLQVTITVILCQLEEFPTGLDIGMQYTNVVTVVVTTCFFIFRLKMFGKIYLKTPWFYINLWNLLFAWFDIILGFVTFKQFYGLLIFDEKINKELFLEVLLYMRCLRILTLFEFFSVYASYCLHYYMRAKLAVGCDIARGFVRASEMSMRLIDQLSDDPSVRFGVRFKAEMANMRILRELGFLQGLHPDIAIGVKTRQAIRAVLNAMREGMQQLMEDGEIDEPEGLLFIKVIESKMKRLQASPPVLQIPSVKKILSAISWIDKDEELVDFILQVGQRQVFQYGDIIMHAGDNSDGIYFIISGLVKVEVPMKEGSLTSMTTAQTIDFLSTGNVIGEISVLTQKPRSATLTCETIVKTLFISTSDLALLLETFSDLQPPLLERLWRISALRISINVMSNVSVYVSMRKEAILARMENAVLEAIDSSTTDIHISKNIMDTILILGQLKDPANDDVYEGPCYIPKKVRHLKYEAGKDSEHAAPVLFYVEKTPRSDQGQSSKANVMDIEGLDSINF